MKESIERSVTDWVDQWTGWVIGGVLVAVIVLAAFVGWKLTASILRPDPTCPSGYVLAGGGYAGRYHCVPGAEPIR